MDNRGDTALDDFEFWKKIGYRNIKDKCGDPLGNQQTCNKSSNSQVQVQVLYTQVQVQVQVHLDLDLDLSIRDLDLDLAVAGLVTSL